MKYDKGEAEKNSLKSSFKKRVKETVNQEEDDDEESHLTYELDINDQREISNNPCILENNSTANNENDLTENRTEFNNQLTSEMCQRGEVVNAGKETKTKLIIDSGASSHMINDLNQFKNIEFFKTKIKLGGTYFLWSEGRGDTEYLKNALYVPNLKYGLISISKLDEDGLMSIFGRNKVEIVNKKKEIILSGFLNNGLYYLDYVKNHQLNENEYKNRSFYDDKSIKNMNTIELNDDNSMLNDFNNERSKLYIANNGNLRDQNSLPSNSSCNKWNKMMIAENKFGGNDETRFSGKTRDLSVVCAYDNQPEVVS